MINLAKGLATWFGIGYIQKGAGTVAALFCCILWWLCNLDSGAFWMQLLVIGSCYAVGVWSANVVERFWGHDSNRIVIDEVLGMGLGLFLLPYSIWHFAIAFILFRFFDMVKPLGIRRLENLPSGWGVMTDDLAAGIYTFISMQVLIKTTPI